VFQIPFQKFLKKQEGHSQVYNLFYLKASGFDNIPAKVIKQCKPIVSNQLTSLINLSIDTGVFPDSLKKA
jgi:hypothetical protein